MSSKKFDKKAWLQAQRSRSKHSCMPIYDYFDFATQIDSVEAITDLTFIRSLEIAEHVDVAHRKEIAAAHKLMTQRANPACEFGRRYQEYWKHVSARHMQKQKETAVEILINMTCEVMVKSARDISEHVTKRTRAASRD